MTEKVKIELEFLLKTSPKVLENMLCTPSGLSEWFADDVDIKDDVFTFKWDGSSESARLISKKPGSKARFQWMKDEEEGNDCYFEMRIVIDDITKDVAMQIAAMNPVALDKGDVDANTINRELEIAKEQIRAEGKPEEMVEKIAQGKLNKFYKEQTLLNQEFVKDSSKDIRKFLDETSKGLTVTAFKRVVLGA